MITPAGCLIIGISLIILYVTSLYFMTRNQNERDRKEIEEDKKKREEKE